MQLIYGIEWSCCWTEWRPHKQAAALISAKFVVEQSLKCPKFEFISRKWNMRMDFKVLAYNISYWISLCLSSWSISKRFAGWPPQVRHWNSNRWVLPLQCHRTEAASKKICCCCLCQPCKAIWSAVSCGKIGRIIFINAFAMLNDFQRMDANSTACHF